MIIRINILSSNVNQMNSTVADNNITNQYERGSFVNFVYILNICLLSLHEQIPSHISCSWRYRLTSGNHMSPIQSGCCWKVAVVWKMCSRYEIPSPGDGKHRSAGKTTRITRCMNQLLIFTTILPFKKSYFCHRFHVFGRLFHSTLECLSVFSTSNVSLHSFFLAKVRKSAPVCSKSFKPIKRKKLFLIPVWISVSISISNAMWGSAGTWHNNHHITTAIK